MKPVHSVIGIAVLLASCGMFINKKPEPQPLPPSRPANQRIEPVFATKPVSLSPVMMSRVIQAKRYAIDNGFSSNYCFFVDMSIHSGRKRFFVYDLERNEVIIAGLVAHGSCRESYLTEAKFSNTPGCGCSSVGKYRIGEIYRGQYGKSYKLYGLENTNSNAYRRAVVLHGFACVPDQEIYPKSVCNSLGCAMVSPNFFNAVSLVIERSRKPIILWIYK